MPLLVTFIHALIVISLFCFYPLFPDIGSTQGYCHSHCSFTLSLSYFTATVFFPSIVSSSLPSLTLLLFLIMPTSSSCVFPSLFRLRWQGLEWHSQWDGSEQKSKAKGQLIQVVTQQSPVRLESRASKCGRPSILTLSPAVYSQLF